MTFAALASAALLGFIWLGYPAAIRLIARGSKRAKARPQEPRERPYSVSVILATREAAAEVNARVANILESVPPDATLDVVVALDSASAVSSQAVECEASNVRVVRSSGAPGKPGALNAGVAAASGEFLVFTDTHQRFKPNAILHLIECLEIDPRLGAVSGRLELVEHEPPTLIERYWRLERRLRRDEAILHSAVGVTGAIYAMRRKLWKELPDGLILDDLFVPMRLVLAGHRVGFTDKARAGDERQMAPENEFRRKVRTLTGIIQLCAWLPDVLVPWRNPIWLQFMVHKVARLFTPYLMLIFIVSGILALLGSFGQGELILWGAGTLLTVCLVVALSGRARYLMRVVHWTAAMFAAILVATYNGMRGRWDVWARS